MIFLKKIKHWFSKKLQGALIWTSVKLEEVVRWLNLCAYRLKIRDSNSTNKLSDDLLSKSENSDDLLYKRADSYVKTMGPDDAHLANAVKMYFLAKQAIIYYDARVSSIPVQVFNELRNALDHFMRSLIYIDNGNPDRSEYRSGHIKKMEGHLQRAFLDVSKLACAQISDQIESIHRKFGDKAIENADDGKYIRDISAICSVAEYQYIEAKEFESRLGGESDDDVRRKFIKALSSYVHASEFQRRSIPSLYWAKSRIVSGLIGAITIAILGKLLYDIFKQVSYSKEIILWIAMHVENLVVLLKNMGS